MNNILLKQREVLGLKQWMSPRGRCKAAQWSKWLTIGTASTPQEAQSWVLKRTTGLGQRAAFYQGKMIVNPQGRVKIPPKEQL